VVTQHEITAKFRVGPTGFVKVSKVLKKRTAGITAPILKKYKHMNGNYYANFLRQKLSSRIRQNLPQVFKRVY
jgi:hypothetical protein